MGGGGVVLLKSTQRFLESQVSQAPSFAQFGLGTKGQHRAHDQPKESHKQSKMEQMARAEFKASKRRLQQHVPDPWDAPPARPHGHRADAKERSDAQGSETEPLEDPAHGPFQPLHPLKSRELPSRCTKHQSYAQTAQTCLRAGHLGRSRWICAGQRFVDAGYGLDMSF